MPSSSSLYVVMVALLLLSTVSHALLFNKIEQRLNQTSNVLFVELDLEVFDALSHVEVEIAE
jgi:hypothetical protein